MRILIVDSNKAEYDNTENIIRSVYPEADVIVAEDVFSAKKYVETQMVDLALVEIKLPCDNGYRVVKMIKTFSPTTHVSILTSSKFGVDCYLGMSLGADDFFVKSIRPGNSKTLKEYLKRIGTNESANV